jgi:hypothetical protein
LIGRVAIDVGANTGAVVRGAFALTSSGENGGYQVERLEWVFAPQAIVTENDIDGAEASGIGLWRLVRAFGAGKRDEF